MSFTPNSLRQIRKYHTAQISYRGFNKLFKCSIQNIKLLSYRQVFQISFKGSEQCFKQGKYQNIILQASYQISFNCSEQCFKQGKYQSNILQASSQMRFKCSEQYFKQGQQHNNIRQVNLIMSKCSRQCLDIKILWGQLSQQYSNVQFSEQSIKELIQNSTQRQMFMQYQQAKSSILKPSNGMVIPMKQS